MNGKKEMAYHIMTEIIDSLIEWDKKYPPARTYTPEMTKKIEEELTLITERANNLKKYIKANQIK